MSYSLEELIRQLERQKAPYSPLSRGQLLSEAQNRYQSVYDQKKIEARQAYEATDSALLKELTKLQKVYADSKQQSNAAYQQAYREADQHAHQRGMQRSSYNEQNLSSIEKAGLSALQTLRQQQTEDEGEIASRRSLLSGQLARQLAGYENARQADTLKYFDELQAREYERMNRHAQEQNQLSLQIYQYRHQLEQEAAEQARWQAEYNAKYGVASGKSSGGGARRRGTKKPKFVSPAVGALTSALLAAAPRKWRV